MTTSAQHDRAALIESDDVERILANIDAHRGNGQIGFFRHGGAPFDARPFLASLAGEAGARPDHSISRNPLDRWPRLIEGTRAWLGRRTDAWAFLGRSRIAIWV